MNLKQNKQKFTPRVITKKSQKKTDKGELRTMQKRQLYENKMETEDSGSGMFNELTKCICQ